MQIPTHPTLIKLTATKRENWTGHLLVAPVMAPELATTDLPRKKLGEYLFVPGEGGTQRMLVSAGLASKLSAERIRRAGYVAGRWLVEHRADGAGFSPAEVETLQVRGGLQAFCEGLLLGAYRFEDYRSTPEILPEITIHCLVEDPDPELEALLDRLQITVASANYARALTQQPPNLANPLTLAEHARVLASENGLTCKVLGEKELQELGANALLAVGLGSKTPSQLIVLEYPGQGEQAGTPPVVVLGKAITFDTGGYSLKDRTGIVGMKYDKSGGAAVFGIMRAVAGLKLPVPVIGIVAAAENMISSNAYRPNDILTTLSGKTVEIVSADAEGRLVLCDALTYAQREYQPRAMIDLATLTGGIVIALGSVRAGLFSNNDDLAQALLAAGERSSELLWPMPLDDDYFDLIKGDDADLKNSAGKNKAHPVVGGLFLKQFVADDVPWAHLDIAGKAYIEVELVPYKPVGATGYGVRLLVDYLSNLS